MYPFDEINTIKEHLINRHETVAVAESVTSGHVQAALSLGENAREFYQGGLTVYNVGQKARHLQVEPIHALTCNGVSANVAEQMAAEVARIFSADYGLSITGYAAAVPEQNIFQPFAFFSIAMAGRPLVTRRVVVPEMKVLEEQLGAIRSVLAMPEAPKATIDALRVQLWFTREILAAFTAILPVD